MIFANSLIFLGSFLIFLFIFWKRLKEDYSSEIIFSAGFLVLFTRIVFWFGSKYLGETWFFWLAFFGSFLGLLYSVYKFKMRFFETFEAFVLGSIPTLSFLFLEDSIKNSSLTSFITFILTLILLLVFYLVDSNYRKFGWYKSGKIGLSGLLTLLLFFLMRVGASVFSITVLTFAVGYEIYLSGGMAVLSGIGIFILSRKGE